MKTGKTRDYFFGRVMPDNCICAEIGVRTGDNADRILRLSNPQKLYLIDSWDFFKSEKLTDPKELSQIYNLEEWYRRVVDKYKNNKNVEIIRELSVIASKQFEDNYFDWVYIDAAHDYESVMEDIESWWTKVKQNGYLCGHDYEDPSTKTGNGVKLAVDEFCEKNNLELYYKGIGGLSSDGNPTEWCVLKN